MTVDELARCMNAGSPYVNEVELTVQGYICQRDSNHTSNKSPKQVVIQLASSILQGQISDPTQGANRWFSPRLMPKESEKSQCRQPIGEGTLDCDGGLEVSCGATERYRPGWAIPDKQITLSKVRDCECKIFKI